MPDRSYRRLSNVTGDDWPSAGVNGKHQQQQQQQQRCCGGPRCKRQQRCGRYWRSAEQRPRASSTAETRRSCPVFELRASAAALSAAANTSPRSRHQRDDWSRPPGRPAPTETRLWWRSHSPRWSRARCWAGTWVSADDRWRRRACGRRWNSSIEPTSTRSTASRHRESRAALASVVYVTQWRNTARDKTRCMNERPETNAASSSVYRVKKKKSQKIIKMKSETKMTSETSLKQKTIVKQDSRRSTREGCSPIVVT